MDLESIALWSGIAPILVGTIFMVSAPKQVAEGFYKLEVLKGKSMSGEVGGLICHVFFMLDSLAWMWGCVNLGLALGLPPVLAITPSATSLFGLLAFMFVTDTGITGVPGLAGPPVPARIIMGTVAVLVNANLFLNAAPPTFFWLLYVVVIAVPQLIGAKHRAAGWMTAEITG